LRAQAATDNLRFSPACSNMSLLQQLGSQDRHLNRTSEPFRLPFISRGTRVCETSEGWANFTLVDPFEVSTKELLLALKKGQIVY